MFAKTGFPESKILEMHGNIFHLQCFDCQTIYVETDDLEFELDHS